MATWATFYKLEMSLLRPKCDLVSVPVIPLTPESPLGISPKKVS